MNIMTFPPDAKRSAFEALFSAFERDDIETAVDLLIERLDAIAGDPDVEANGDEFDHTDAEDEIGNLHLGGVVMPGCPISDPDLGGDDEPEATYPESIVQRDVLRAYDDDEEPWHLPPMMDGPTAPNDQVRS